MARVQSQLSGINLAANLSDPTSVFYYYQRLIALRKQTPALIYGTFEPQAAPDELFVYRRVYQGEVYTIVLNLSEQE